MRTITFALLCLMPGPVPAPPLTVDEAVARAIRQNPRLAAAAREVAAARTGVRSAQAPANPELTFTPAITAGGSDEELSFRQPLELNGTRTARTGVAGARLRQAAADALIELRSVVFETKAAYYDLLRAQELFSQAQDLLRLAEEFDRITRRQVELGARPGIEQTQTGIEVARARQQVTLAESRVAAAVAALNTLMGVPPVQPVGPLPPLALSPAPVDREAALRQALASRGEIATEAARRDTFLQEARLARAEGRPDLVPQFRAASVTRGLHEYGVGIGVTLPIFDYGSRRTRVRQAEESARAQSDRIAAARDRVRQEVDQALVRLQASEAVVRDYQGGVLEQAQRLVEASRIGLQAGQTTIASVLEAQRTYRAVRGEYTNALVDAALARAELERATGAVSPDLLPGAAAGPGK